ncbi:MAG: drug/metabolite exporter YedA [Ardenticatenales bacterium]|nr:drug/metabolite exporter YedA [Ardenticatenales bacterium]
MLRENSGGAPSRWHVIAAFAAVYVIWGSTYLAIRFAIETIPPLLMAGTRYFAAGALLYGWLRMRGAAAPSWLHWRYSLIIGAFLLLGGNGAVTWAEQLIPSGLAALLVALVPLWMVLLDWLQGNSRLNERVIFGLILGLVGLVLLIDPSRVMGGQTFNPLGVLVVIGASLSWAIGSVYSRRASLPESAMLATAMEMLAGGALLVVVGLLAGEGARLNLDAVSLKSALAFIYLIVFGSLVAFTAYIWLLQVSTPARVSTYAYVNPVVAVFLGWAFAGEALTMQTALAAAVIVAAVGLITSHRQPPVVQEADEPQALAATAKT